jgi:hypothetical protein
VKIEEHKAVWVVDETTFVVRWIHLGQLLTFMYFAFFLLVLPILGVVERAKPLPSSIEAYFAAKHGQK